MTRPPLLRHSDLEAPFARCFGATIKVADFLRDVASLAALLPDRRHVANLCQDRYRFTVGFAASLCREQVTVLPPSEVPAVMADILARHDGIYCINDTNMALPVEQFRFPESLPAIAQTPCIPAFPSDRIAAILTTSGSTGRPQTHPRSWGLLVSSAISAGREIGADRLMGASLIGTVPHQHSYGLESLVMLALQHGLVLHAERPFYPQDILACLADAPSPRMLVTTPVHLRVLLAEQTHFPSVDLLLSATAPLSQELAFAAEEGFAGPLHEIYGCSEVGQIASRRTVHTDEWRCLEGIGLRQQGGASYAHGTGIAEPTRLADIIELRDPRHFRLLGRDSDNVNIGGKRSSLAFLASQLRAVPGVQDAAFTVQGAAGGGLARLVAFAVAPGLDASEVLKHLRPMIDPVFLPRPLHLVERLPRDALGKITQASLVDLLAQAARS